MQWEDLRLVKAIADAQGLAGAAILLKLDHSTVFRRLGALEKQLGLPLFERRRSAYQPTSTGEVVLQAALRMEEEVNGLERRLQGRDIAPSGEIRVTTADSLLMALLNPLFARFRQAYPDIRLDVVVGNMALNLSRRDADIAIRATDQPPETLVGRRIGQIAWALYGQRASGKAEDLALQDVASANWVALSDDMAGLKVVEDALTRIGRERLVYRTNSVLALVEAIEAGLGIGHAPCFLGDARPDLTRLTPPIDDYSAGLWLLTHADIRHSPRIRAFMDFFSEELTRLKPRIEGQVTAIPVKV